MLVQWKNRRRPMAVFGSQKTPHSFGRCDLLVTRVPRSSRIVYPAWSFPCRAAHRANVMWKKYLLGLLVFATLLTSRAQLAITEIVSSGSTNLGATLVTQKSDWWELSNFGTNTINLDGYKWNDNAGG